MSALGECKTMLFLLFVLLLLFVGVVEEVGVGTSPVGWAEEVSTIVTCSFDEEGLVISTAT